jgi:hypothetical protein
MHTDHGTLAATPWQALAAWEADPDATILTLRTAQGPLYAIGRAPAVWIGRGGWEQTSPEELDQEHDDGHLRSKNPHRPWHCTLAHLPRLPGDVPVVRNLEGGWDQCL